VNSRTPAQLYRLPGTNRDHPDLSFCKTYGTTKKELRFHGLDPHTLAATTKPVEQINVRPRMSNNGGNEAEINELRTELRGMTSGRNALQYRFARALEVGGRSEWEIRAELNDLGISLRTINDSIKSLKKRGYLQRRVLA
jgi:hypothetical protein